MKKKVLFLISMGEENLYNLRDIKENIRKEHPSYYHQVQNLDIDERPACLNSTTISPTKFGNVSGHWLAENISTPSKVIDEPMTIEVFKKALSEDTYTHVCITAFLDSYNHFKECMEYLIDKYPEIIRLLGNVGANYAQYRKYFDPENICYGDGVPFLRKLLGEPLDQKYKIPATVGRIEILGEKTNTIPVGILTTATGCPHRCDFCVTATTFQGKYNSYDFTAKDIRQAILKIEEKIGINNFLIFIAEPNAFLNQKLWYDVFDLFRHSEGSYGLIAPISLDILSSYDLNRLQNSAIRLEIANVGIESVNSRTYNKLKNKDIKSLLKKFESYGISMWGTFIMGFPGQSMEEIQQEVDSLIDLNPTIPALLNLRPIRGTQLFSELEQAGKIDNDFLGIGERLGFMSYHHDAIGYEFPSLLKLMLDLYNYIESKTGHPFLKMLEVKLNQRNINNLREFNFLLFLFNSYLNIHQQWIDYFCKEDPTKTTYFDTKFNNIKAKMDYLLRSNHFTKARY